MDEEIRHIDLCSGIGGFALAASWAGAATGRNVRTVAFSEIDPFCQAVLRHHWPGVPVIPDLRNFDYEGGCDLLTAGYPCQPFSVAGKQKGAADDRHLWPHVFEIVKRKRPAWCLFENVSGHITLGLDQVLLDLENEGYAARPLVIPACSKNAPHRRDRVWIVAHSNSDSESDGTINAGQRSRELVGDADGRRNWGAEQAGRKRTTGEPDQPGPGVRRKTCGSSADVADPKSGKSDRRKRRNLAKAAAKGRCIDSSIEPSSQDVADAVEPRRERGVSGGPDTKREDQLGRAGCGGAAYGQSGENWWTVEPQVGRLATGVPNRVAQLRALGNAIVPQVAAEIMEAMFRNWKGIDQ